MVEKRKYGIWGGRFQIIHKGHEYVLLYVARNYSHVCIGIVNPNPQVPAWDVKEHERFDPQKNPFTYFQRVYLWDKLLRFHSIDGVIVPHWHPRKCLKMESTFLPFPQKSREWVIPFLPDEDLKIKDFEKAGENVQVLYDETMDLKIIHASEIRRLFEIKDSKFKVDIPEKIRLKTEEFLSGKEFDEQFIVVPILSDNLHPLLFCGGMQLSFKYRRKLIFAPVVNVQNKKEWWKFEPIQDFFTFYQKYEIINSIMKKMQFYDYYVVPIFVKNRKCQAIDAFLPNSNCRSWLFVKGINSGSCFEPFKFEEILTIDPKTISSEIYADVFISRFELFNERHYFNQFYKDIEERNEDSNMPKNDFRNANIGNITYVEGNNEGNINVNSQLGSQNYSAEDIILDILRVKKTTEFENLFKKADAIFADKSVEECQQIIEDIVRKHIDSAEKKSLFLEKFKQVTFNIGNSVVGGILLQIVKNLMFGA